jgi:uncharacterized protein (DUF58 family)
MVDSVPQRIANWLEHRWVAPAYSGWLLGVLSIFFFMAGANTLAGWLYVLSGIGFALLTIAALLPALNLRQIRVNRSPLYPVSVGDHLIVELVLENPTSQPKTLLQVQDWLPESLSQPISHAIEAIAPHSAHHWTYDLPTQRRGVYRWQAVYLRTAAPLGLFWCRRSRAVKATAIVYPTVLTLTRCPLVDELGRDTRLQLTSDRRTQTATEGLTRALRPYRWGDPTRLVHWRTSARYGELRVRELETLTGGQELIICLDSASSWHTAPNATIPDFEQAVIAAASLYFYACHACLNVKLWTAGTGLIQGSQVVLEALASVQAGEAVRASSLPTEPIVWLTQNPASLSTLPPGSRWLLWTADQPPAQWQAAAQTALTNRSRPGLVMQPELSLQIQLQRPPGRE